MHRRALLCLALSACTIPLVPTEPARVEWVRTGRHGAYEKLGVPLTGMTCGEQYHRAVAGNPEAERLMDECLGATKAYGVLELGFVTLPALGLAAGELFDRDATGRWFTAGATLGVIAFVAGFAMALHAGGLRDDAVHAYNRSVSRAARLDTPDAPAMVAP